LARVGRTVFRVVVAAAGVWIAWRGINWYASAGADEPNGACATSGIRCAICTFISRDDCHAKPLAGCPATAIEYVTLFPKFDAKLKEQRTAISRWIAFRKEMEAIQNRSSVELCRANLDRMKKTEEDIPITAACAGRPAGVADVPASEDEATLMHFRDCSEAKARELSAEILQRDGGPTSELQSLLEDVTKTTTDSIELLRVVREEGSQAAQVKCWLRDRIRDCGR
jgi:hypothetical protein